MEVPYEIKKYQRLSMGRAPPELLAVNPLGKAPVITDGEFNIAESGAIIGECVEIVQTTYAELSHGMLALICNADYIINKYGHGKIIEPVEGTQGAVDDLYCGSAS